MVGLLWPVIGHHTTQRFAGEHPFEPALFLAADGVGPQRARVRRFPDGVARPHVHGAIDIGCPVGTRIFAPERGRIVAVGRYDSTGERYLMLQIRPGTVLFFTHLKAFRADEGEHVRRGQLIALSGNSGMSTGPHLHWEVRVTSHRDADVHRSGRWFKWNPRRLRVGGDLAGLLAIQPKHGLGDHDPEDEADGDEPDGQPIEVVNELIDPVGEAQQPPGTAADPLAGPAEVEAAAPVPLGTEIDPDPDDVAVDATGGDADDTFGDAAALLDRVDDQHIGGPAGHH